MSETRPSSAVASACGPTASAAALRSIFTSAVVLGGIAIVVGCSKGTDDSGADGASTADLDPDTLPQGVAPCRAPLLVEVNWNLDGDTIEVTTANGEERVRFIGVDAPEIAHYDDPADCWGPESADYTESLLPVGTKVWLTFDRGCKDAYDRTLAYLHLDASETGFIQRQMLRNGLARTMTFEETSTFAQAFADDEQDAREQGSGLWSACR